MNVLVLTQRLPYAPNRGDRIRAFHLIGEIGKFATIDLFSFTHDADEDALAETVPVVDRTVTSRVPTIRNVLRGIGRLPTDLPLTHSLLDAPDARTKLRRLVESVAPTSPAYCSSRRGSPSSRRSTAFRSCSIWSTSTPRSGSTSAIGPSRRAGGSTVGRPELWPLSRHGPQCAHAQRSS
jgi:hypothetical protein